MFPVERVRDVALREGRRGEREEKEREILVGAKNPWLRGERKQSVKPSRSGDRGDGEREKVAAVEGKERGATRQIKRKRNGGR